MQNYWDRYDWLSQAYPFKCVGTYESQILVDFTDNPPTLRLHVTLGFISRWICATPGHKPWGAVDEIPWKSNEELVTLLYWDTWESRCGVPPLRFAHTVSVWERPPRCLIRYIIRETAGRGCGQLTRGCRGRISCDFLEGLRFGLWDMFRSHVLSFIWYPRGGRNKFSEVLLQNDPINLFIYRSHRRLEGGSHYTSKHLKRFTTSTLCCRLPQNSEASFEVVCSNPFSSPIIRYRWFVMCSFCLIQTHQVPFGFCGRRGKPSL